MTLIVTSIHEGGVLQVGDRLVTRSDDRSEFDARANKQLAFIGADGVLAVGYSGIAFIEGVHTDVWIAHCLRGELDDLGSPPGRWASKMGGARRVFDLGTASVELRNRLNKRLPPRRKQRGLSILAAGWQWDRKGLFRPVMWAVENHDRRAGFDVHRFRRSWQGVGRVQSLQLGVMSEARLETLGTAIVAARAEPDSSIALMAEAIRGASVGQALPVVGQDCMAIDLPPPNGRRDARILYLPARAETVEVRTPPRTFQRDAGYTPWVVGPGAMHAPRLFTGAGWSFEDRGTRFLCTVLSDCVKADGPQIAKSQDRPPMP
jgi:hypothetical protein